MVGPSLVTSAIEEEASDPGNQKKLAACPDALRRHLFVVLTLASTDSALWALHHILEGMMALPPQPALPDAITTAWAGDPSGAVFVMPPNPWQIFKPTPELRERYAPTDTAAR